MKRYLLLTTCCLLLLLPACQGPGDDEGQLTVVFPLETTELTGGQSLRVTVSLVDNDGQPVEGATVQAELRAPNGTVFATRPCAAKGQGLYLADYVTLPLRGAGGSWRVVARATWGADKTAQAERTFKGVPSISEVYQEKYGFWLEQPMFFEYSPLHPGEPHYEDWPYEDGGGYVIIDNYRRSARMDQVSVSLDVHWRRADLPVDEAAAIAHVQSLAGLYRQDPDASYTNLAAEPATFQSRPASTGHCVWRVTGQWEGIRAPRPQPGGPVEWMIFRCPGSDWLWTLVISTNDAAYMDDLRALRAKFECPPP